MICNGHAQPLAECARTQETMNFLGHDYKFWMAVGGATLFKVLTSREHSFFRGLMIIFTAIFAALVATDPILHFMSWPPEIYKVPVAALCALTGDNTMRWLMKVTPDALITVWKDLKR